MSALISTLALSKKLYNPHLRIVDASWHMPAQKRNAYNEYLQSHIPGAVFFDLDAASDTASPYPHMLPGTDIFSQKMVSMGLAREDEIVIYDTSGLFSAARLWWMLRVFGHSKVSVLDGGLPKWQFENRPLESGSVRPHVSHTWRPSININLVRSKEQVQANIEKPKELLIDARSPERFKGEEAEPREGLKRGHIAGSKNIYFKDILLSPHNTMKSKETLQQIFKEQGIKPFDSIAVTCGSGVTACILALALYELGNTEVAVYDGAWAEWGSLN